MVVKKEDPQQKDAMENFHAFSLPLLIYIKYFNYYFEPAFLFFFLLKTHLCVCELFRLLEQQKTKPKISMFCIWFWSIPLFFYSVIFSLIWTHIYSIHHEIAFACEREHFVRLFVNIQESSVHRSFVNGCAALYCAICVFITNLAPKIQNINRDNYGHTMWNTCASSWTREQSVSKYAPIYFT